MIHAGTDLKFRVKTQIEGFTMKNDDFSIVIKDWCGRTKYVIYKRDCLVGSDGNYYFTIDNVPNGLLVAVFKAKRIDTDFEDDYQTVVDRQNLVYVGGNDYCCDSESQETDGMAVAYKRVWTVNISGYVFLAEEDGTPILDSEGQKIYLLSSVADTSAAVPLGMTSAQLKQLLEGHNPNGKIDTIPELIDAAGGINDDTEVGIMTAEEARQMMRDKFGV